MPAMSGSGISLGQQQRGGGGSAGCEREEWVRAGPVEQWAAQSLPAGPFSPSQHSQ